MKEKKKLSNTKKKVLKIILVVAIIIAIGVATKLILNALGGFDAVKDYVLSKGNAGWIIYILIRIVLQFLLISIPGVPMALDIIAIAIWGSGCLKTFFICYATIVFVSIILDLLGRFGGSKLISKIVGKENYEEASRLVNERGLVYIPIMYLLPVFPDDALCVASGSAKMKFWLHVIYIMACRGIGCFCTVYAISFIPEEVATFTSTNIWDYIEVATIIAFWLIILLYLARKLDKKLAAKFAAKRAKNLADSDSIEKID